MEVRPLQRRSISEYAPSFLGDGTLASGTEGHRQSIYRYGCCLKIVCPGHGNHPLLLWLYYPGDGGERREGMHRYFSVRGPLEALSIRQTWPRGNAHLEFDCGFNCFIEAGQVIYEDLDS